MSLHKTHICVVKSLVKIAAVSWHSLRRFIKPAPAQWTMSAYGYAAMATATAMPMARTRTRSRTV